MADDEEWEYEYDPDETETFYITLDLTNHIVPSLPGKKHSYKSNKSAAKIRADKALAQKFLEQSQAANSGDAAATASNNSIQIVDLHSENPLISYNNQFYTCHWATDIGTSVFLSAPNENPDLENLPLRSFRAFDLIGTTSARLMGVPATIQPRVSLLEAAISPPPSTETGLVDIMTTAEGDTVRLSETGELRIELPSTAPPEKVSQARFLERLSAIKRKRGQTDSVPVKAIKGYTRPDNWEEERNEWLTRERAVARGGSRGESGTPSEYRASAGAEQEASDHDRRSPGDVETSASAIDTPEQADV